MSRICEVCGRVEENTSQEKETETLSTKQMSILHVCESCIKDRQHPHF
jgi:ribosome-binding protein aMBF1 (putative translation factor)